MKTQKELAYQIGRTPKYVSDIFVNRVTPGRETAERLEKATGIPAHAWLWPDRFENPYIQLKQEQADD